MLDSCLRVRLLTEIKENQRLHAQLQTLDAAVAQRSRTELQNNAGWEDGPANAMMRGLSPEEIKRKLAEELTRKGALQTQLLQLQPKA